VAVLVVVRRVTVRRQQILKVVPGEDTEAVEVVVVLLLQPVVQVEMGMPVSAK
jgi:hypothetical protein